MPNIASQCNMDISPTHDTVVVVCNDDVLLHNLRQQIGQAGLKIFAAGNIEELNQFEQYDNTVAIIFDIPTQNTDDIIQLKRYKFQNNRQIPLVAIGDKTSLEMRSVATQCEADRFFSKPVNTELLNIYFSSLNHSAEERDFRALIIDDEPELLEYYACTFNQSNIATKTLTDPSPLFEELSTFRPDILVFDLHMPKYSGIDLAKMVRQDDTYAHIPIIILSSEKQTAIQNDVLRIVDNFIAKTSDAQKIIDPVLAHLNRKRYLARPYNELYQTFLEYQDRNTALNEHAIVSVTDASGNITFANNMFCEISGYDRQFLIGKSHRILKSAVHDEEFYSHLWQTISKGEAWHGEICNQSKNGQLYWVESTIFPVLGVNGTPYKYISIRTDISKIKEHQQKLDMEKRFTDKVIESLPGVFYVINKRGKLIKHNSNLRNVSGYDDKEIAMMAPTDFFGYENQPIIRDAIEQCFRQGAVNIEAAFLSKSGQVTPFYFSATTTRLDGETCLIGTGIDISERIESEMALRAAEERTQRSQQFANIGTWDWNIQTGEIYLSERSAPLFGFKNGETKATYKQFLSSVHHDDRTKVTDAISACLKHSVDLNLEHRCVWPNGETHWVLVQGDVVRDKNGVPSHMLGVIQKISRRKALEQQLEKQQQLLEVLRSAMTRYVATTDLPSVANYLLDSLLKLTNSKHGFVGETLHTSEGKAYLKIHAITKVAHDEKTRKFFESAPIGMEFTNLNTLFGQALKTGKTIISHHPESDPRRGGFPDGHPHLDNFIGIPIYYGSELLGMYGLANCEQAYTEELEKFLAPFNATYSAIIHAKRMMEQDHITRQQLLTAKDDAIQANSAKSQFLSNMSHELRTPLNAILGFSQLLEMEDLPVKQKNVIEEISGAGSHLLELINEMLDMSKIESGQITINKENIPINELLEECAKIISPLLTQYQLNLEFNIASSAHISAFADRVRLKQILINLLSNACKYNKENGNIAIQTKECDEQYIKISIKDSGKGISYENQSKLFTPFARLDAEDTAIEGTGIGLVITKKLVEIMDGKIEFHSVPSSGSTFSITLPSSRTRMMDRNIKANVPVHIASTSPTNTNKKVNIIYIEDNPVNLKLVTLLLAKRDYFQLLTADDPKAGLELIRNNKPDILLLDINLPGMTGLEVLQQVKLFPGYENIPIVAVSANAMPEDIARGREAGFTDYISKPINVKSFYDVLDKLVDNIKTD